jgi:YgiT-type zinc finger domain-containing protein
MNIAEAIKDIQCPICGHIDSYRLRNIDKIEHIGNNTMIIPITIGQCDFCGEQIMDADTTTKVFEARKRLAEGAFGGFTPVGATYRSE